MEDIGLQPVWDEPDNVAVVHDDVQLDFTLDEEAPLPPPGWAFQPGWANGQLPDAPPTVPTRSISIALQPSAFTCAVARLQARGRTALRPEPFWVGYWSFVVLDPAGNTVEISDPVSPESRPRPSAGEPTGG